MNENKYDLTKSEVEFLIESMADIMFRDMYNSDDDSERMKEIIDKVYYYSDDYENREYDVEATIKLSKRNNQ